MMQHDFSEYAALWREQIHPEEVTELQEMAGKIGRTVRRRWLADRLLGLLALGVVCWALWRSPAVPLAKLCLVLLLLMPAWLLWKRHQIIKASRAIAADDPQIFFEAALENARVEISLSTLFIWTGVPWIILCYAAGSAASNQLEENIRDLFVPSSTKFIYLAVMTIMCFIYVIRDNIRFRRQWRRLEAMRREWDKRGPEEEP